MNFESTISITYIADAQSATDGPAVRMLQTAIEAVNNGGETAPVILNRIAFGDLQRQLETGSETCEQTIFLVNLSDPLCLRDETKRIVRGPSYETVATILNAAPDCRVFLVLPPGVSISGIDLVACFSGGVAGVIEERALIVDDVISRLTKFHSRKEKRRCALLIGSARDRIEQAHTTVLEWNEDDESDDRRDLWAWRTALALAQLEKLEPVIGSGHITSYKTLATALNIASHVTAFALNLDELQRVLSRLAKRWLGENHEPYERFRLPEYARKHGFPILPVHVTCVPKADGDRRIYEALQVLSFKCDDDVAGMPCCRAQLN